MLSSLHADSNGLLALPRACFHYTTGGNMQTLSRDLASAVFMFRSSAKWRLFYSGLCSAPHKSNPPDSLYGPSATYSIRYTFDQCSLFSNFPNISIRSFPFSNSTFLNVLATTCFFQKSSRSSKRRKRLNKIPF